MTDQRRAHAEKMSVGRKHASSDGGGPSPKRGVMARTVDKWIVENDKALNTATWLKYDKADREYVATLKCSVCIKFQDKLRGVRNYNPAFIGRSTNLRTSNFKDHAATDIHEQCCYSRSRTRAMSLNMLR